MLFATAAAHRLLTDNWYCFNAPDKEYKKDYKIVYQVWEKGYYRPNPILIEPIIPVPTEEYHVGWVEYSVKHMTLAHLELICRSQHQAIKCVQLFREKIYIELKKEYTTDDGFDFPDTYGTIEIYLGGRNPWYHLRDEVPYKPNWGRCYNVNLEVFKLFEPWCFIDTERIYQQPPVEVDLKDFDEESLLDNLPGESEPESDDETESDSSFEVNIIADRVPHYITDDTDSDIEE